MWGHPSRGSPLMYWGLFRKQTKGIGTFWWSWIIFRNGWRHLLCLNNLQQVWHISWSLKLFPGLASPCRFTLTRDVTSNRCCSRKFADFWILRRLGQHPCTHNRMEWWNDKNRTLGATLSKFVQENQRDWDQLLPLLAIAYRSAIHESTGCTPNELMFGLDVRLPVDLMFGSPPVPVTPPDSWQLREQVSKVHQLARENLNIASQRQKRLYDQRSQANSYQKGKKVWLYNPQSKKDRSPKLRTPWEGPWEITKQVTDVVYRIQKTSKGKAQVCTPRPPKTVSWKAHV